MTMKNVQRWATGLVALAVLTLATGCPDTGKYKAKSPDKGAKATDKAKEEHSHDGPHDGAVADWGDDEYHAEFTVDHKTKSVKVYILGPDVKKPTPIKTDKVTLSIKKPAFQVELKPEKQKGDPEGTASVFVGTDDRFGVEQEFEGTLSAAFGGKQYAGDFKEEAQKKKK
jgi:hypothetical protein